MRRRDSTAAGAPRPPAGVVALAAWALLAAGCMQEMADQPRLEPYEQSDFFADGKAVRQLVEGTVARGQRWGDDVFFTGLAEGQLVESIPADPRTGEPFDWSRTTLERGRQRFDIYCSMCHGRTGYGDGMVVRRGFHQPPSLHEPRLRNETPAGHFFQVISDGYRKMPAQASRISPADRWAIVAYIRALQNSQHLPLDEAPDDVRARFSGSPQP